MSARTDRARAAVAARIARLLFLRGSGRKVEDLVVVLAGTVNGNLAALASRLHETRPDTEVAYLLTRRSSRRPDRGAVLRPWRLRDLRRVARARVIVTAQGPGSLRTWIRAIERPLFVDLWHGVGFKSRITTARQEFRDYDAHFAPSPFIAAYYERAGARAVTTGYGRMDALVSNRTSPATKSVIDGLFADANGPLVLFAPTWGIAASIPDREALRALSDVARSRGARILYRPHSLAPAADVDDLPLVRRAGHQVVAEADDLLPHVAVLITDWSSIATDFLALDRPVVYVDAPAPGRDLGPLTLDDRPGPIVSTAAHLADAVDAALQDAASHVAQHAAARAATIKRAWGSTLDGGSTDRYIRAIDELEHARRGTMDR